MFGKIWMGLGIASVFCGGLAGAATVRLNDGTSLRGEVVARTDSTITVRSMALGDVTVRTRDVAAVADSASGRTAVAEAEPGKAPGTDPSDQALFFMPTAFTPPARSFTFRDFELFFMTLGYAPTSSTSITGGLLFPISADVQLLTLGLKQNLWSGDGAAVSVTGNVTKPIGDPADDFDLLANGNLVAGKRWYDGNGGTRFGLHAGIGYLGTRVVERDYNNMTFTEDKKTRWHGDFDFGIGMETEMTSHAKFIAEYLSAAPFDTGNDLEGGLLTVGFRLHGERLSADIAGIRPITDSDLGSFVFAPLLVVSYRI